MTTRTITPLGARVLVQPIEAEEVTATGIIIPDVARRQQQQEGTVVAVGEGRFSEQLGDTISIKLAVGDMVVFGYGIPVENTGGLLLVDESQVFAIVKDEEIPETQPLQLHPDEVLVP